MKTIPFSKTAAKHVRAKLRLPEVLELPLQGFTKRELKTAYKKLSLRYHPDKNMGNKAAAAKFTEVCEAYETLLKRFE
ncbi:MAG: DnaJ domain-containing protein [Simkaniaceae bacterium]|nr:DnaJ domain-containing protein [Simkaniaceae bacterium]